MKTTATRPLLLVMSIVCLFALAGCGNKTEPSAAPADVQKTQEQVNQGMAKQYGGAPPGGAGAAPAPPGSGGAPAPR